MNNFVQYYVLGLAVYFFIYVIIELGYNIQFGMTGIANLFIYVIVAFGGYVGATVTMGPSGSVVLQSYIFGANLPFPLPLVVGCVAGAVLSAVIGVVVLGRLKDQYLAIVTLVLAQMAYLMVGNYRPIFNGFLGLTGIPQPLASLASSTVQYQYLFVGVCAVVAVICFVFCEMLSHSPLGRVLRAVREDETVAATFGRNVFALKLKSTIIGGALAGVGGALFAEYLGSFSPGLWSTSEAFVVVAALLIGGKGNNWGACLGAFLLPVGIYELTQFIPSIGSGSVQDAIQWITIGVLLALFLWFRPQGLLAERRTRYRGAEAEGDRWRWLRQGRLVPSWAALVPVQGNGNPAGRGNPDESAAGRKLGSYRKVSGDGE